MFLGKSWYVSSVLNICYYMYDNTCMAEHACYYMYDNTCMAEHACYNNHGGTHGGS